MPLLYAGASANCEAHGRPGSNCETPGENEVQLFTPIKGLAISWDEDEKSNVVSRLKGLNLSG